MPPSAALVPQWEWWKVQATKDFRSQELRHLFSKRKLGDIKLFSIRYSFACIVYAKKFSWTWDGTETLTNSTTKVCIVMQLCSRFGKRSWWFIFHIWKRTGSFFLWRYSLSIYGVGNTAAMPYEPVCLQCISHFVVKSSHRSAMVSRNLRCHFACDLKSFGKDSLIKKSEPYATSRTSMVPLHRCTVVSARHFANTFKYNYQSCSTAANQKT